MDGVALRGLIRRLGQLRKERNGVALLAGINVQANLFDDALQGRLARPVETASLLALAQPLRCGSNVWNLNHLLVAIVPDQQDNCRQNGIDRPAANQEPIRRKRLTATEFGVIRTARPRGQEIVHSPAVAGKSRSARVGLGRDIAS